MRVSTGRAFASAIRMLSTVPVPPLPSPAVDRSALFARKFRGVNGALAGRDGLLAYTIADMDLQAPQPIVDAVTAVAASGIYGYTDPSDQLTDDLLSRLTNVYGCAEPRAEWLRWQPGLLPGLNHAVRATCRAEADAVAIATPIYPPFLAAPTNQDARRLLVPLRAEVGGGGALRHELDLGALEDALALPSTRLLMWCQPQNPSGRCWSAEEMAEVARLCVQHDVVLLSDEVWGEMPLEPEAVPFVSALSLLDDVEGLRDKLIVLTSPSKCFNIATTNIATAIIPNASLRRRFAACGRDAAEVTPFGYAAAAAAYGDAECEAWRQRMVAYVKANRDYAAAVLRECPGVATTMPEASYLLWIDATAALPADAPSAETFFLDEANVWLSPGESFGAEGGGYVRMNLACSRETLAAGLERMRAALVRAQK